MSYRETLVKLSRAIGEKPVPIVVEYSIGDEKHAETFLFKRLSGAEVDAIQLHSLRSDGKGIDPKKLAGHSGRVIAAALVEEDGKPYMKSEEVNAFPQSLREALFKAAAGLNNLVPKKDDESEDDEAGES